MKKIAILTGVLATAFLTFGFTSDVSAASNLDVCVSGCTYSTIEAAYTAAQDGDTITLESDMTVAKLSISKTITIDLNSYTLSSPAVAGNYPLKVEGGNLTLVGPGKVVETTPWFSAVILKGSINPTDTNYSVLTVGKDVELEGFYGIMIDKVAGTNFSYGVVVNLDGKAVGVTDGAYHGVGIYVNGSIQDKTNAPIINITSNAVVASDGPGIYAAGYATWTIAPGASVSGVDSALAVKSGEFIINGGTFTATGADTTPTAGFSNGVNASGATIQIESNKGYSGGINFVIQDGTFVSENGRVFYEYLDTESASGPTTETAVSSLAINGGDFIAKDTSKTVFMLSEELTTTITGFVHGGTFSSDPTAYAGDDVTFAKDANGGYTTVETTNPETSDNIALYALIGGIGIIGLAGTIVLARKQTA